jgi:hypothetical protein
MADIGSPTVVAAIDAALNDNAAEREELLDLRKMAVRRHGEASADAAPSNTQGPADDFHLTVAQLIESYRTDERSGFHEVRHATRQNYISLMRRIEIDIGAEKVASLSSPARLQELFDEWSHGGEHITVARGRIAMIRILATFGASVLESRDCRELKLTLHDMRFERPAPISDDRRLKLFQAKNIIAKANELGLHSMALAQAFQIECGLKQKDVIGEFVPVGEPGEALATYDDETKWVRGLVWQEIGPDFMLRHVRSWSEELLEMRLTVEETPLVRAQLDRIGDLPKSGPVIINEKTDRPYQTHQFRRLWREIATEVGVPRNVMNRDSA